MSELVESNKEKHKLEVKESGTENSDISAITIETDKENKRVSTDENISDTKHIDEV